MSRGRGDAARDAGVSAQQAAVRLAREAMDAIAGGGDTTSLRTATTKALAELDREGRRTLVATLALLGATLAAHVPAQERERVLADASVGAGLGVWLRLVLQQSEAVLASMPRRRGGAA